MPSPQAHELADEGHLRFKPSDFDGMNLLVYLLDIVLFEELLFKSFAHFKVVSVADLGKFFIYSAADSFFIFVLM